MGEIPLNLVKKSEELNKYYEPLGFRIIPLYWTQTLFVDAEKGKSPQEIIMEKIGEYDLFFGMMGSKYGEILPGYGVSPTEFEFNNAIERKARAACYKYPRIVCFSFLGIDNKDCCDPDPLDKINKFRGSTVRQLGISHTYENANDIESLFVSKLSECIGTTNVKYSYPKDYKIQLYISDSNEKKDQLFRLNQKNLIEEIKVGKRILLSGSGGSGKSTYLKYIAYLLSYEIDSFVPVFIKLKLYDAKSIGDTIIAETRSLPPKPILLIDGYDELSDDLKLVFHKHLLNWIDLNTETPIVITSRPLDQSITPMRDFTGFDMSVLAYDQFRDYLRLQAVNENIFTSSPIWNEIYSLSQIPFYLVKIVDFYKQKGIVPRSISEILEFSILQGIESDKEHFEATFTADYEYDELGVALSELAFCMTNSGKSTVTRKELLTLFKDDKLVLLLRRYVRLIESVRNPQDIVYSFSHKIFQDYLAAKAIHKIREFDILKIITNLGEERISFNWEPSIQYILEFLPESERESISQHISRYQPDLLIEVMPELLNENTKQTLFTSTFEYYSTTIQYIPRSLNLRKLASVWDSLDKEKYLINFIRDSKNHNYMIIEAFVLLSYSKQYNKKLIDEALVECIQNDSLIGFRKSLNNIATMYIFIEDFDQQVLRNLFNKDKEATVQLLVKYDSSFLYINELIDLYLEIDHNGEINQRNSETKSYIEDYLVHCFKSNRVHELVAEIINKQMLKSTHCLDDEIDGLIDFALEQYKLDEIYEDMYHLYIHCLETMSDKHIASISKYFITNGIEYEIVKRIFDENKEGVYHSMLIVLNQNRVEFVKSICIELLPTLSYQIQEYLFRFLANSTVNPLYIDLIKDQGIDLDRYNRDSISSRKALRFDQDLEVLLKLDRLEEELVMLFGSSDELSRPQFKNIDRYLINTLIYNFLRKCFLTNTRISKHQSIERLTVEHVSLVLDFIEENYIRNKANNLINDENNNQEITIDLREWLEKWKSDVLSASSVLNAIQQIDQFHSLINMDISKLWIFIKEGLTEVKKDILLDYLSFVDNSDQDWDFIESKISNPALIKLRVLHNLENMSNLSRLPLANHVWFCVRNHYSEVLPHAYDILRRLESDFGSDGHLSYCCIESIIRIESNQSRFDDYVKGCPIRLLNELAQGFIKEKRSMLGLIHRLKKETQSAESEYKKNYLYYLCCLGDDNSVISYAEAVKRDRVFHIEHDFPNPFENIAEIILLVSLVDLLTFGFENEIKQSMYHNLTRCILTGIENLAYQSKDNYDNIISLLTGLTSKYLDHIDTYILFESIWRLKEEYPKRTAILPTLLESLVFYNSLDP